MAHPDCQFAGIAVCRRRWARDTFSGLVSVLSRAPGCYISCALFLPRGYRSCYEIRADHEVAPRLCDTRQLAPADFLLPAPGLADIYKCIVENELHSCIELGTGIGATSCIMAAAVDEVGNGRVVTVDMKLYQPVNVEILKRYADLGQNLEVVVDDLGYNWYLADLLKRQTETVSASPSLTFACWTVLTNGNPMRWHFFLWQSY